MTARDLLRRMPEVLDREAAADIDAVIQYEVSDPVHHVLRNGELTTHEGRAEEADLTVRVDDEDLVKLFDGRLNPLTAFMSGRVRVQGDMQLAQRLVALVDRDALGRVARDPGAGPEAG